MLTLNLRPEVEEGFMSQARANGLAPEDYLQHLVEKEYSAGTVNGEPSEQSGMVWEDGLLIYGTGAALPAGFIDNALRRSREERSQHILGSQS